jgi:hypothetical protein
VAALGKPMSCGHFAVEGILTRRLNIGFKAELVGSVKIANGLVSCNRLRVLFISRYARQTARYPGIPWEHRDGGFSAEWRPSVCLAGMGLAGS